MAHITRKSTSGQQSFKTADFLDTSTADSNIEDFFLLNTSLSEESFHCSIGEAIGIDATNIKTYKGPVSVTSKPFEDYQLKTKDSLMLADITVQKIPTYETSNDYGTTINIGG